MSRTRHPLSLGLEGLELAPGQRFGRVRLVPLLRHEARGDLRLAVRRYDDPYGVVSLDGEVREAGVKYFSYIPHGLVVRWSDDGSPVASLGAHLGDATLREQAANREKLLPGLVRLHHRMVKREDPHALRLLPLHLAMEGFLACFFSGPPIAWQEYSRQALAHGLDPRSETTVHGRWVGGLEDALRRFEIHVDQVGALLFVGDQLHTAFVTPHPSDWRALHTSLLEDFFSEVILDHATFGAEAAPVEVQLDAREVTDLPSLRRAHAEALRQWHGIQAAMASALVGRPVEAQVFYTAGPFQLQRFLTDLRRDQENFIGEAIVRADGTLEYLKTFRLSKAMAGRLVLLRHLDQHAWNLDAAAAAHRCTRDELVLRLENAGFGYLVKIEVLQEARRALREGRIRRWTW